MRLDALVRTLFTILLVNTLPSGQLLATGQTQQQAPTQQGMQATTNYGKLPLIFEANQGQTGAKVKFLSRGQGYTAFLTASGITLSLRPNQPSPVQQPGFTSNQSQRLNTTLQFKLLGAARNPAVIGENQQSGIVNYFLGKDPTKWLTKVPTFARVRYKNIYPGIDLIYYGNHQQLEYDLAVSAGADPSQIQFEITGANQIDLDDQGNLVLQTASGELRFQTPVIYQESGGLHVPVSGAYVVNDPTHISFHVAQYDSNKPLVIDPVLLYGTYLGGTGSDQAAGIAVDSTGSVYIAGYTDSVDFTVTTFGSPVASSNHVFVTKLNSTGSSLVYADYLGGNSDDYAIGLALDSSNNVYVTGSTTSSNFPTVNPYQSSTSSPYTGFVSKISADGSTLVYSTYLGGSGFDVPASIAVDTLGEAYVAGTTTSEDFPVFNAYQSAALSNQGGAYGNYGFLTKFTTNGSSVNYSTYFAGNTNIANCGSSCYPTPYSEISAVAVDANGNAYVAGTTNTSNFPYTPGAYLTNNSPVADATIGFLSKFASAGTTLDYSTYFYGSSGNPVGIEAITVDGTGSAYITGTVSSDTTFPTTSTSICNPSVSGVGCSYAFVSKFDPTAANLLYSTFLGLNNYASPQSIALDSSNNAYVVANTNSSAFGTNNAIEGYTNQNDVLLVEIDASATTELFASYLGGSGDDFANGIALDANGNIYVVGSTNSADFPVTQGAFQNVLGGGTDAFVVKIGPNSAPAAALSPSVLQYAEESVGSTSTAQTVLLRNMGSAALSISSIATSGDFAETNTCGTDIAAASSCTFSITFTPTAEGLRSGQIVIQDNASGSPHVISLSGVGSSGVVAFAPTSLTFSAQQLGTSSAAQTLTLTNNGNASLSISNIQTTGDYSQTNNCSSTLSASSNCTLNITFTPTVAGTRSGSVSISDNLSNSPQTVALTGTAYLTAITAAPASLTFGTQMLNTSSTAQVVTVTNASASAVTVSSVVAAGDFAQTNNCSSVAPNGGSCNISVTFTPTATGIRTGTVTITDNAGSPQTVSLTGTGSATAAPIATLSPTSLTFTAQQVGTSGAAQAVSLTNSGTAALTISSIVITGNYSQINNCPSSLAAGSACAISVTFTPTTSGVRTGTLTVSDNATGSSQTVSISGSGSDFSLASSPGSDSVKAGSAATYNLTITPLGGSFASAVKLACSGLPAEASCTFTPASVNPGGSTATSTLSITTTASTADALPIRRSRHASVYAIWIQLQGVGFLGMVLAGRKRSSKKMRALALLVLLIVGLILMTGCAGGTGIAPTQGGTTSGSYTITVTGTSGSLQHSIPVTLTVQ